MKYFLSLLIVSALCSLPAIAQTEEWDTYVAKFGDRPASVLVDLSLRNTAPDKRFPFLVITGPKANNCGKQGMPNKDEIGALEEILDATQNFMTGVTAKVLVATVTSNCQRLNYYYVKDTGNIRNAIARMYDRSFANYSYVVKIKHDPDWVEYRASLYPTEATQNWMLNSKIMARMISEGDSLKIQRNINFDLYFRSDTSRAAFAGFARSKGYNTDKMMLANTTNAPYQIVVSKYGYVKMALIDSFSTELKAEAKRHNGFYNGWEAPAKAK